MMRKLILWVLAMPCLVVEGQQLKLGSHPSSINKASLLELESNNQGLLLTRIPDTTVATLTSAPTGMLIFFNGDSTLRMRKGARWMTIPLSGTNLSSSVVGYNLIINSSTGNGTSLVLPKDSLSRLLDVSLVAPASGQLLQYNGSQWTNVTPSYVATGSAWLLGGNTMAGIQTLGTNNSIDLPFETNNIERMRLTSGGSLGIGTTTPSTLLHVFGTNPLTLTGVQTGATTDSLLTITNGLVRKLPASTYLTGTGLTAGSIPFIGTGGVFRQNNASLFWDSTNVRLGVGTNTPGSDLTVYQSIGTTSKGIRLTGNSIGGVNVGSGFAVALGYNQVNNKQLWLGDPDYMGNVNGTFVRYSASSGSTIVDAVSGDNSVRRPTRIGVGNDPLSSIILGDDANGVAPGSYVWDANNMAIGTGYRSSAAPSNGLIVQGNVGIGTAAPATALQVTGTNPLTLMGVQTGASTDSILTITGGLVRKLPSSTFAIPSNSWNITGNSAASTNFLGTTNNVGLHIRTNNTERMYIDSVNGTVGIGTNTFTSGAAEKLLVNAGTTTSYNAIVARGSVANYFQLNINNQSSNSGASSDIVATADNGTESANYVDFGINSSAYNTSSITGGPDNGYLYSTGNDFVIGNGTSGKNLIFFTGGTASTNEAMRINGSGQVGIANANPAATLDVGGTFKLGSSGTVLNNMIKGTYTVGAGGLPITGGGGTATLTATITNAAVHASVLVSPEAPLPAGVSIAYAYVSATGTVKIGFVNAGVTFALGLGSTVNQTIGTGTVFDITVIQ